MVLLVLELVRALERQQRTRESFWVSVFIHQEPKSQSRKFCGSPALTAFLQRFNEQSCSLDLFRFTQKATKGAEK